MESNTAIPDKSSAIRLVIADVDGTLVTPDKVLTPRAVAAVRSILDAGIAFTITSGRPPRGMRMLIDGLHLQHPIAAFNGGVLANPDLSPIRQYFLPASTAQRISDIIAAHHLDVWLYTDRGWFVHNRHGPHVAHEEWTVKFPPAVEADFRGLLDRTAKIVGVSDDYEAVARCEKDVRLGCGDQVSAARSQPYYLDVTHVPEQSIATIGDMPTDILMFQRSGVSIAMGQASDEVKHAARFVTASNADDGFAIAMETLVLGRDPHQMEVAMRP